MQISYVAGEAAQAGVQEWAATGNAQLAGQLVNQTLGVDGYSAEAANAIYLQQGSLDKITVSLPVTAPLWPYPDVSSTRSAFQGTGAPNGNGEGPWW